jgi:AcrR family transcriptional regulator
MDEPVRAPDPRGLDAALPRPAPRRGRTRRNLPAEVWRERILQAARVLFAEEGYDGPSMEDIARLAGLSRARLYHLFPSRRDVFNAVISADAQRLGGELLLALAQQTTTRDKVSAMVRVFFGYVESRHERNRVFYAADTGSDPAVGESLRVVRTALAETFAQHLAQASDRPSGLSTAEIRLVANGVIALAEGAAASWLSGPHIDRERSVEIVTDTALRALDASR